METNKKGKKKLVNLDDLQNKIKNIDDKTLLEVEFIVYKEIKRRFGNE